MRAYENSLWHAHKLISDDFNKLVTILEITCI
jgi:hypothetical protein